jgi:hypothetical protein
MKVPEAAMNEDDGSTTGENDIRLTRQRGCVESVPVAQRENQASNSEFWLGVLAPDAAHIA